MKKGGIESLHDHGHLYQIILNKLFYLGRIAGIEPASSPWQREILPFDHIRIFSFLIHNMCTQYYKYIPRSFLCSAGPKTLLGSIPIILLIVFFQ